MKGRGVKKPYHQDMFVISTCVLLVFSIYVVIDLPKGPPDWFRASNEMYEKDNRDDLESPLEEPMLEEVTLVTGTGHTGEGTTDDEDFEVQETTGVELRVSFEWTDDIGDNDEFEITLYLEDERVDGTSGRSGSLELTLTSPGPGNYTLSITAVDCPGMVGPFPVDRDYGNDWSVEIRLVYEVAP